MSSLRLHPASRLLAWILFALLLPHIGGTGLVALSVVLAAWVVYRRPVLLRRYLLRLRILLATLILLYAYATPGDPVLASWGNYAPTWEGLRAGGVQAWRLLILVTSLSIALDHLNREGLLAGIYTLLLPLRRVGLPIDRMSARLSLTLHYVEQLPNAGSLGARWDQALALPASGEAVHFSVPKFSVADGLLAVLGICLSVWVLG